MSIFSGSKKYEGFDIQANIDLTPKDADGNKQQQPDQTSQPKTTAEGTYQLDDTRQEVRATVGPGEIIMAPQLLPNINTETLPTNAPAGISVKTDTETEKASRRYTKTAVNLRKGPGTTFDVLKVLPKDVEVSVLEIKGRWSRVQIDNQNSGWIANSTLLER